MKPVQAYKKETLEKLKQWICDMNLRNHEQYYEIFVDGIKVVHKTNDTEEVESYLTWIDSDTQQIRVLTYNTKASHRSKVFEFRTNRFEEEPSYKELYETEQKKNEELIKRLEDAEEHICNLEQNENKKQSFDLQSILTTLGSLSAKNPDLAENLGGLGGLLNNPPKPIENKEDDCKVSFKKKQTNDAVKDEIISKSDLNQAEQSSNYIFKTDTKLKEDQAAKMYELMQFFANKSEYINIVHDLVIKEKGKDAA